MKQKYFQSAYRLPRSRRDGWYTFFKVGFFTLLAVVIIGVYFSYDYWMFKLLISQHYAFTETLDTLFEDALGEGYPRGYFRDFDRMVIAVVTERIRGIDQDWYTNLRTPQRHRAIRETERADAQRAFYEALTDDTVYVLVPNISTGTRQFMVQNQDYLASYRNIVLDLRGNYGGLLLDFQRIASLFVERGNVIGHERTRLQLLSSTSRSRAPRSEPAFDFDNIIILQDDRTASAAESLIMALTQNLDNVITVGDTTFGKGIGQVTIRLTGGYAVSATVLVVEGPDGEHVHNIGIPPDRIYDGDDLIAYALNLIQ